MPNVLADFNLPATNIRVSTNHTELLAKIDQILGGAFKSTGNDDEFLLKQQEALRGLGVDSKVGYILHAGRVVDGTLQVQFNSNSEGWSSRWPAWAYEPARDSLLHGKQVWVIYQGDMPFGSNLLHVLIFPYSA